MDKNKALEILKTFSIKLITKKKKTKRVGDIMKELTHKGYVSDDRRYLYEVLKELIKFEIPLKTENPLRYERTEKQYTIEEVLSKIIRTTDKKMSRVDFDGDLISMNSLRYQTFSESGIICKTCGIEGKFFAKERNVNSSCSYHFNLYAINKKGNEVLMTKDHIHPTSKGGRNNLKNLQTMCVYCNRDKADLV